MSSKVEHTLSMLNTALARLGEALAEDPSNTLRQIFENIARYHSEIMMLAQLIREKLLH